MDIKDQINDVLKNYRSLKYDSDSNSFLGKICITPNDCYEVIIDLSNYPTLFPVVYEVGERIPQKMDRHKYSDSDASCFTTSANAQILLKTRVFSLSAFIKDIATPYFISNSFFELNGYYSNTTYSHGITGVFEGYKDILVLSKDVNDIFVAKMILNRIEKVKIRSHELCYCGSGNKLKRCCNGKHEIAYRNFRLIDIELLKKDLISFLTSNNS
jgi:hypothetical protein